MKKPRPGFIPGAGVLVCSKMKLFADWIRSIHWPQSQCGAGLLDIVSVWLSRIASEAREFWPGSGRPHRLLRQWTILWASMFLELCRRTFYLFTILNWF
jgi:hypothetical protein